MKSNCNSSKSLMGGFTVIELGVTLVILGILVGMAIPSFPLLMQGNAKRAAREIFEADITAARNFSATENARGVFTFSAGNNVYTFGIDYPPYSSGPAVADTVKFRRNLPRNVTITPNVQILTDSRGIIITSAGLYSMPGIIFAYKGTTWDTVLLYPTGILMH